MHVANVLTPGSSGPVGQYPSQYGINNMTKFHQDLLMRGLVLQYSMIECRLRERGKERERERERERGGGACDQYL